MNDPAPPPAPAQAPAPASPAAWQAPDSAPHPTVAQTTGFDPRRAMGTPSNSVQAAPMAGGPIMAPPPALSGGHGAAPPFPGGQPPQSPYAAQSQSGYTPMAPYQDQAYNPSAYADQGYVDQGYTDPTYSNPGYYEAPTAPQSPRSYVQSAPVEPAGRLTSLLSKLPRRNRRETPTRDMATSARKPFIMGLLTGVVVMLILGQIFRASEPAADYAQVMPQIDMTISEDGEEVAFLDQIEGLE